MVAARNPKQSHPSLYGISSFSWPGNRCSICPYQQELLYFGSSFCSVIFKLTSKYRCCLTQPLPSLFLGDGRLAFFLLYWREVGKQEGVVVPVGDSSMCSSFNTKVRIWRLFTVQWQRKGSGCEWAESLSLCATVVCLKSNIACDSGGEGQLEEVYL